MLNRLSIPEKICAGLFVILSLWWVVLYVSFNGQFGDQNLYWAATYQIFAWGGGIFALITSRSWGGMKSFMGRAVAFFGLSLIFQGVGQATFSIYTTILQIDIPYPSIADIGYFCSTCFYIAGIISLAKVSGVSVSLRNVGGKIQAFLIPLAMLVFSYAIFLQTYEFDWSAPLRIFLDFGYPLGDALYVSAAILTYLLSRDILGGIMKGPLTFVMIALIAQYCADFNFLYQAANGSWINGGYGDFMYLFSYFLMATSLAKIESVIQSHRSAAT